MEQFSQSHKNLQIFCADFWPSSEDCQLILNDIGLAIARINMAEPSIMRWLSIINELRRRDDGSMGRLVIVLIKQYPENQTLKDVCAPWIPATPAKAPQEVQPPTVPPGAVLVKKFDAEPEKKGSPKPEAEAPPVVIPLADEMDLLVPRVETLWRAMVDIEKRMVESEKFRKSLTKAISDNKNP